MLMHGEIEIVSYFASHLLHHQQELQTSTKKKENDENI